MLEAALEPLVGGMAEAVAAVNGNRVGDTREHRIGGARSVDLDVDALDQHRLADIDSDADVPVMLLVGRLDRGADFGIVVAVWLERRAHLVVDAVVEPLHGSGLEPIVVLVALETQQRQHVAAQLAVDPSMSMWMSARAGVQHSPAAASRAQAMGRIQAASRSRAAPARRGCTVAGMDLNSSIGC